ncbi:MAG: nucleoside-diphosphate kinase [Candidatus Subteraquimicrobiales bacterium]|nr:nucleoside-diphosphate kinase [Candidatus Subteraquimicrobiales bacterium]
MTEETFVMIKPDGVRKKLVGEIIKRFELKGLNLKALKLLKMSREIAEELYSIHRGRPFFEDLVNYVTSGEVVVMVLSGEDVISAVRKMMGATNPKDAEPGTIRGDFALDISENIIHGSDSKESAEREIPIFFKR